jgi:hypothetical protein
MKYYDPDLLLVDRYLGTSVVGSEFDLPSRAASYRASQDFVALASSMNSQLRILKSLSLWLESVKANLFILQPLSYLPCTLLDGPLVPSL